MSKWQTARLEDISDLITKGTTPTTLGHRFTRSGINFVKSESVTFDGWIDESKFAFISSSTHEALKRSQLRRGDILFSMAGVFIGKTAVVPSTILPANTNQAVGIVRLKSDVACPRFVDYHLRNPSYNRYLNSLVAQSAQPNLNLTEIRNLPISLPPLSEQRAIAHILGTLDDKIELNRRMNQTLEAIAQALFKEWFIDPAQDALPKGWHEKSVYDICENIFSGGTPSTSEPSFWGGTLPWLSSGETRNRFIIQTEKSITNKAVVNSSTRLARAGCTVIASAGQGHTRGQTSFLAFDSYINQSVVALSAARAYASDLFLFFNLSRRYEEFRRLSDSHSIRGSLTTKLLGSVRTPVPPRELITAFDAMVAPTVKRIIANIQESRTLAQLRDTLLPKLLSGELRIKDAEKFLKAKT